jgi:hypothetical protein
LVAPRPAVRRSTSTLNLQHVAVGAVAGAAFGVGLAVLLSAPHAWPRADVFALAVHAAVLPTVLGALTAPVFARFPKAVPVAVLGLIALVWWDLGPSPPAAPGVAVGPEVAVDAQASVLVIAVDGADWGVLQPLIDAGEAPHLAALQEDGVSFPLRSLPVMSSPIVWTTVATGRAPEEHGIGGFLTRTLRFESPLRPAALGAPDPRLNHLLGLIPGTSTEELPVTSLDRRTTAIWNQATAARRSVVTVGWWGTWPAEPVFGVQVSDHAGYQRLNSNASAREVAYGQVHPPSHLRAVRELVVAPSEIEDPLVPSEPVQEHDPASELRVALAAMETYGRIGEGLVAGRADLSLVYFQAVDIASHYFWAAGFGPGPDHAAPTPEQLAAHGDVVNAVYRRQDAWIGRLVEAFGGVSEDRVVIVLSDHGFGAAERVQKRSPHVTGTHRRDGILLAAGGPFSGGEPEAEATVYDVAPTLLHLLGLPAGDDMPGRVWTSAIGDREARRVPTWEGPGGRRTPPPSDAADRDKIELLRGLGYL